MIALQVGIYAQMKGLATELYNGQVDVANPAFLDNGGLIDTLPNADAKVTALANIGSVKFALPRVEAFALASVGQRSFGAQVLGVDIAQEQQALSYLNRLTSGRLPEAPNEAVIGSLLARNLRAEVGAEIVILGSAKYGGVAAAAWQVVGILTTGIADMDRALVVAPMQAVQPAFELDNEVHRIVLVGESPESATALANQAATTIAGLEQATDANPVVATRSWQEIMPEVKQSIDIDRLSGRLMYWIVLGMVSFTVVNSFVMTIFERTHEFGMLRAIGMRPGQMVWLLQWGSLFVWLVGSILGISIASALILWLSATGFSIGAAGDAVDTQLFLPKRMYPAFSWEAVLHAPAVMLVGCQLASLFPALRLFKLQPVAALREH